MSRTLSSAGSLCVILSTIMMLQFSPSAACCNTEVRAPTILSIQHRHFYDRYRLTCKVNPGGLKDETLVYWLADGDFLESVYKNIRVTKMKKRSHDGTEYLYNKVVFMGLSDEHFHTNFTCVALSPAGFAKENVQIRRS